MNKKSIISIIAGILVLGAAIALVIIYFKEIEDFLSNLKYRINEKFCELTKKCQCPEEPVEEVCECECECEEA